MKLNPDASDYQWKSYNGRQEVEKKGVTSGCHMFVGGGFHDSVLAPTMLEFDNAGCYSSYGGKSFELPSTNCVYLVNQPGKFKWIFSRDGKIVVGAVKYHGVQVGRCYHERSIVRVGRISEAEKCMYYPYSDFEYNTSSYEVLVYKP
jgi:hypothetical protein